MMLEKSCFCDAHFHFIECLTRENVVLELENFTEYYGCTCAHSVEEWYDQKLELEKSGIEKSEKIHILKSFGMHPQNPVVENAVFLENLLKNGELDAVGEAGFDFFTDELKQNIERQKDAWHIQVELAAKYQKPLIVHCRKAMSHIFMDINTLAKIPAILFHSFPGPIEEAHSVLYRLPEAFFSYGKQILNGNKKVISCMENLPLKNILLETDAPFQRLKDEKFTSCREIERVYGAAFNVRNDLTSEILKENFFRLYF